MDRGAQLWDAFRSGDMRAFEELYHQYYRSLYNYGFTILADKEAVMDCLHELFLDLWERRAGLPAVGNVKYYLLVAFRRRVIRSVKRYRQQEAGTQWENEPVSQASAEDDFLSDEARLIFNDRIRKAFDKLPPRRQEAIYLRYFQQLSYRQITVMMEIEYQTVRDLISKGLKTLRHELQGDASAVSSDDRRWDLGRWS